MPDLKAFNLPFQEAIDYFQQKVNLPAKGYADLMGAAHSRAFVVAGATKNEILADFRTSIDKMITDGKTITDFRKDFDKIVEKHGWDYNGKRGWRTGVIYDTNLRTAHSAGMYKQMMDESEFAPYWRYNIGQSKEHRPLHVSWNGTVLRYDDPWWKTHFTPNGWGCKCHITNHSKREIEKNGWTVSGSGPDNGTHEWKNPKTGEMLKVPNGIDPGWDYNPGQAAGMYEQNKQVMDAYQGEKGWERLPDARNNWTWQDYERLELVPTDHTKTGLDYSIPETKEGMEAALNQILAGKEKVFSFQSGDFGYNINVNAENLAKHIAETDPKRAPYLSLLNETMQNPYEVWLSFEKNKNTGKVVLRQRIIKAVELGGDKGKNLVMVINSVGNQMEAWTMFPSTGPTYINKQRVGTLIWKR